MGGGGDRRGGERRKEHIILAFPFCPAPLITRKWAWRYAELSRLWPSSQTAAMRGSPLLISFIPCVHLSHLRGLQMGQWVQIQPLVSWGQNASYCGYLL